MKIVLVWELLRRFRDWFRDLVIEVGKNLDPHLVQKQSYIQLLENTCWSCPEFRELYRVGIQGFTHKRQDLKSFRLPQGFQWIWTIQKYHSAVSWLCLQYRYWIYWGCLAKNASRLSHTNLALLTNMPRNDARWLQHPCLFLIFRETFQNPTLLNKNMKTLSVLEEKIQNVALNIGAICTKSASFWSHNVTMFACNRRKKTWSTDVFMKWHAVTPLPQCNGHLCIVTRILFFACFNLKKETSLLNKNNSKQFLQFWNIQKDTSPHRV